MASADREKVIAGLTEEGSLWPVIDVNGCPVCATPKRSLRYEACPECKELAHLHGGALRSFEMVTLSTPQEGFETQVREWKDFWRCAVDGPGEDLARRVAAPLSSYLDAHAAALGLNDRRSLLTWVPSSSELIPRALDRARMDGWFAPRLRRTGELAEGVMRQRQLGHAGRKSKTANDWIVGGKVKDRKVLLLDDVYTSGASMHSFAAALVVAGAREVSGLALVRNIGGTVYQEALADSTRKWKPSDRW
jgi:hypothetical protein